MKKYKKKDLYILKATINGFTNEARRIRKREIHPNAHEAREEGWNRKRLLGLHSRFHQLAYAFLLGRRYDDIEQNTPLSANYWQTDVAAREILQICKLYGGYYTKFCRELDEKAIIYWFKTSENTIFAGNTSSNSKAKIEVD